jgi:DNA mismatch repair protein MutL
MIAEKSPAHYQYKGKYIMTAVKSGLMIIDQHRAHVRILYEQYLQELKDRKGSSQKVLFPEVISLNVSERTLLGKVLPELVSLGFELTDLGSGSYAINAIPAGLEGINTVALVHDMITSVMEKGSNAIEEMNQSLALSLARNAAVPQGQVLNNEEMENMVNSLFACSNVNYTPDGKNILCILRQQEIEHLLG